MNTATEDSEMKGIIACNRDQHIVREDGTIEELKVSVFARFSGRDVARDFG
jgi:hypothetical protein